MGPIRGPQELVSSFRLRYGRYCLRWLFALGLPLVALIAIRPNVLAFPVPFVLAFIYAGLPIGAGIAGLAATGFFIGAGWALLLERNFILAGVWPKTKEWLKACIVVPIILYGAFFAVHGFIDGEVYIAARGRGMPKVSLNDDPIAFFLSMSTWCAITVSLAIYQYRRLRNVYAT